MATIVDVRAYLQNEYSRIVRDWYGADPTFVPAVLTIEIGDYAGGFSKKENRFLLFLGEHNLEDFDRLFAGSKNSGSKLGWYANESEFYHELLHEYQYKGVKEPSPEGRALFEKYARRHPDPGHDAYWFTAIAEKALYFGVTPEQLYLEL